MNVSFSRTLYATLFILLLASCGKKPQDRGHADLQALGIGIGEELLQTLKPNTTVLIFGIPGIVDKADQLEKETLRGITKRLKKKQIHVQRIAYSDEEIQMYHDRQPVDLPADLALPALQRHIDPRVSGIVILTGTPNAWASDLPPECLITYIDWSGNTPSRNPLQTENKTIIINARRKNPVTLPTKNLAKDDAQALKWFEQRFSVHHSPAQGDDT